MKVEELVRRTALKFPQHNSFRFSRGQKLSQSIRDGRVPDDPGVYLTCGTKHGKPDFILQIGKSGTLKNDGSFKGQMLKGRLQAKQGGVRKEEYYLQEMDRLGLDSLLFHWFVTFGGGVHIIPAKAEADLIQEFYDASGHLPPWNLAF